MNNHVYAAVELSTGKIDLLTVEPYPDNLHELTEGYELATFELVPVGRLSKAIEALEKIEESLFDEHLYAYADMIENVLAKLKE